MSVDVSADTMWIKFSLVGWLTFVIISILSWFINQHYFVLWRIDSDNVSVLVLCNVSWITIQCLSMFIYLYIVDLGPCFVIPALLLAIYTPTKISPVICELNMHLIFSPDVVMIVVVPSGVFFWTFSLPCSKYKSSPFCVMAKLPYSQKASLMVLMTFPEESTCLRICFPVLEWPPTQRLSDFIPMIWWINSISGTSMDDSKTGDFRYNGSLDNSPTKR